MLGFSQDGVRLSTTLKSTSSLHQLHPGSGIKIQRQGGKSGLGPIAAADGGLLKVGGRPMETTDGALRSGQKRPWHVPGDSVTFALTTAGLAELFSFHRWLGQSLRRTTFGVARTSLS